MNEFSIVTAVCGNNDVTQEWLNTTIKNCTDIYELVIVSNGSSEEEEIELTNMVEKVRKQGWETKIICLPDPVGTTRAFDIGVRASNGDIVAMLHNDLFILEKEWDLKIQIFFYNKKDYVGVCGFVGGKRLGDTLIYKIPYELNQLARFDVYSSQDDAKLHGQPTDSVVEVSVLDGMALIIKKDVYIEIGGLDKKYIHHMYDNDLCISAHYAGLRNYVLPILCHHRGGMTACGDKYGHWAEQYDGDEAIHRASHLYFYKKWDKKLPVVVP